MLLHIAPTSCSCSLETKDAGVKVKCLFKSLVKGGGLKITNLACIYLRRARVQYKT